MNGCTLLGRSRHAAFKSTSPAGPHELFPCARKAPRGRSAYGSEKLLLGICNGSARLPLRKHCSGTLLYSGLLQHPFSTLGSSGHILRPPGVQGGGGFEQFLEQGHAPPKNTDIRRACEAALRGCLRFGFFWQVVSGHPSPQVTAAWCW